MNQAYYYAKERIDNLAFSGYNGLSNLNKLSIFGSEYKYSVVLGNEQTNDKGIKYRNVTVSIYYGSENSPRAKLSQIFYGNDANKYVCNGSSAFNSISLSSENGKIVAKVNGETKEIVGDIAIGTIIAWPFNSTPVEGGTWLLCDGSTFSSSQYPRLYSLSGTNVLPDLRDKFFQGSVISGNIVSPGLPNISGRIISDDGSTAYSAFAHGYEGQNSNRFIKGCFFVDSYTSVTSERPYGMGGNNYDRADGALAFEASLSNPIYGASTTVQPPAYTVRYYIKAT